MREIDRLLQESSRTFALTIPLLPEPLREEVTVAYLLFRIADTLEDETAIDASDRAAALGLVAAAAEDPESFASTIADALEGMDIPTEHDGYARLMRNTGLVLETFDTLDAGAKELIALHLAKTCRGMAEHVSSGERLESVEELRGYCYTVAGIVGDLLTSLFVRVSGATDDQRERLVDLAPLFGEALQLVNILRDEHDDTAHQRSFLPDSADRNELIELATEDLRAASAYIGVLNLAGSNPGVLAFNGVNAALAVETLALVHEQGPGVKVSRDRVRALFEEVNSTASRDPAGVAKLIRDRLDAAKLPSAPPRPGDPIPLDR